MATTIAVGTTAVVAGAGGAMVDYSAQRISHAFDESAEQPFDLDEGRLVKTAFTTGVASAVPTLGNPANSVVDAVVALIVGFDASFINAALEIFMVNIAK